MNRFPPFARCALGFGQCEAPAHADHERKERDEDGKVGKLLIDREGRGAQDRQAEKTLHAGKQNESFYGGIMLIHLAEDRREKAGMSGSDKKRQHPMFRRKARHKPRQTVHQTEG